MTHIDDALTEAVQNIVRENVNWLITPDEQNVQARELENMAVWIDEVTAEKIIAAVRAHDEQAALNCGHCDPNTDEIACACTIKERDDE